MAGEKQELAICINKGFLIVLAAMNGMLWKLVETIDDNEDRNPLYQSITEPDDIRHKINIKRSV